MINLYNRFIEHSKNNIETDDGNGMSYAGEINADVLDAVFQTLESNFKVKWNDSTKEKKFMAVVTELFQNVYHHLPASEPDGESNVEQRMAIFFVRRTPGDIYYIYTGNYILATEKLAIKKRIDIVNSMNEESLKEFYRDKLAESKLSDKGGAGLGVIDIARKSNHKINYKFDTVSNKYSFFSLLVTL